jgi:hypothetical protein
VSKFSDPAVELNLVLPFDDPVGALPISVPSALVRMMIEPRARCWPQWRSLITGDSFDAWQYLHRDLL